MLQTKAVEKIKTHISCSITFFFGNRAVHEIVWENIVERGQATAWQYGACALHAGYPRLQTHTQNMYNLVLGTQGYKHTLRICTIYCFSTTMVARTRPIVTSYVQCNVRLVYRFFTLDAGLLARSQYSEGPATGHLDTGFSRFPCACKQMLRRFPTFQVATTSFSFSSNRFHVLFTCKITTATGEQPDCSK
jgi:hypothetical protein